MARNMTIDSFIHASITTWAIVNTDSAVISLTLLKDKSIDLNHRNKLAKSCIMKTTVPPNQHADFLTISKNIHVFTTQSQNVDYPMLTADNQHEKKLDVPIVLGIQLLIYLIKKVELIFV